MVTEERLHEVAEVLDSAASWAGGEPAIFGVAVVGSWARDTARMTSDVDLVVLTDTPDTYLGNDDWLATFAAVDVVRRQQWGPYLTEVRLVRPSGLEVEVGITRRAWTHTDPVDPGTARVVTDGMRVVYDPEGLFTALQRACASPSTSG